jgi:glycyl-tRNA synthetase beta chain
MTNNFLFELGTEELPPKMLPKLSSDLEVAITEELISKNLNYHSILSFATPRRLAFLIKDISTQQDDISIEKRGPKVGSPENAVQGFAKSCGTDIAELQKQSFNDCEYFFYSEQRKGQKTVDLLDEIINNAFKKIHLAKPMRWGNSDHYFVRPAHWIVALMGSEIVDVSIMGIQSSNKTRGHRFMREQNIEIDSAINYQTLLLKKANIEVDFQSRKSLIKEQVEKVAKDNNSNVVINESLLDEVTALVETPKAFIGRFDEKFLNVPKEVLVSAMTSHQKYFHAISDKGNLLPVFIAVSNIDNADISNVVAGNERVIKPRLNDAEFFWNKDKETTLESKGAKLEDVLFMKSLGSVGDKTRRIVSLSEKISLDFDANEKLASRAAQLCKSDLVSDMVGEFADLQGIMGGYYADHDGESQQVSAAIKEHYQPRFSGDTIPSSKEGRVVAVADKLDSITGIFGIGQGPTGSKDPYALRRQALGLMRIVLESNSEMNIKDIIHYSLNLHNEAVDKNLSDDIYLFMMDRLKAYYKEQGVSLRAFDAVMAVEPDSTYDFNNRVIALNNFANDENFISLVEINKRIANILKDESGIGTDVEKSLLQEEAEISLFDQAQKAEKSLLSSQDYTSSISALLELKSTIDAFFNDVMVNTDNPELRNSRLKLINWVRSLFLSIGDISRLA